MLYASSFGVKGDGSTDDGVAIVNAVNELKKSGPNSTLIFDRNKTYYIRDIGKNKALFELERCKGLKITAYNCNFILDTQKSYVSLKNTKYCELRGMNFDYKTKPAFSATCLMVTANKGTAVLKADRDIGLESLETYAPPVGTSSYFGVLNRNDARCHIYIKKYEMIDREKRTVRVYFDMTDANTANWVVNDLNTYGMICPMPKMAHLSSMERGFSIIGNTNLTLSDIDINSCYKFGMFISQNEGTLTMDNVNFVPADNELDKNMNFTSWRDAFHVKDNRCNIVWKNCVAKGNYDDIFNISSSTLYVSEYSEDDNRLSLVWEEASTGIYYPIKSGDTLQIIDTSTGLECGNVSVVDVVSQTDGKNVIIIDKKLVNYSASGKNCLAFFTNRCAPNSIIENCDFSGTFRFRGPITIKNSKFYNFRTWIDIERGIEGPVPSNIVFENCDITSNPSSTIIINSYSKSQNGYHVSDIKFDSCILDMDTFVIGENDISYVSFENCIEH